MCSVCALFICSTHLPHATQCMVASYLTVAFYSLQCRRWFAVTAQRHSLARLWSQSILWGYMVATGGINSRCKGKIMHSVFSFVWSNRRAVINRIDIDFVCVFCLSLPKQPDILRSISVFRIFKYISENSSTGTGSYMYVVGASTFWQPKLLYKNFYHCLLFYGRQKIQPK